MIIPGGSGSAKTLSAHEGAKKLVMDFYNKKKIVAFICAGTLVAKAAGIPNKHTVTSYPAVKDQLEDGKYYVFTPRLLKQVYIKRIQF